MRSAAKQRFSNHRDTVGRSCPEPLFNCLVVGRSNILIMDIGCLNDSLNSISMFVDVSTGIRQVKQIFVGERIRRFGTIDRKLNEIQIFILVR